MSRLESAQVERGSCRAAGGAAGVGSKGGTVRVLEGEGFGMGSTSVVLGVGWVGLGVEEAWRVGTHEHCVFEVWTAQG